MMEALRGPASVVSLRGGMGSVDGPDNPGSGECTLLGRSEADLPNGCGIARSARLNGVTSSTNCGKRGTQREADAAECTCSVRVAKREPVAGL